VMYLLGYSIDILSLLAITLSVGFLIDDAIVVLENITRHRELGENRLNAALKGSKQISFTILSMTLCLASVFIPMVFMAGIMGKIFREFAMTIIIAVLISGFISLTLTPMLCSKFIGEHNKTHKSWIERLSESINSKLLSFYEKGLQFVLKRTFLTLIAGFLSLALSVFVMLTLPTEFFPPDDLGFIQGFSQTADGTSPYQMIDYQNQLAEIVRKDPNVEKMVAVAGIPDDNQGLFFVALKPISKRKPMPEVIKDLHKKISTSTTGIQAFLKPFPLINLQVGTSASKGNYQYALQSLGDKGLYEDAEKMLTKMKALPGFSQVTSDMHIKQPQVNIAIDRDRASNFNISANTIEQALSYAYSGGKISTINTTTNQYDVIIETLPNAYKDPSVLSRIYLSSYPSTQNPYQKQVQVPLSSLTSWKEGIGPQNINHFNTLNSVTISFNLDGVPLGTALQTLSSVEKETLSPSIMGSVQGTADVFKATFRSLTFLFLIAIFVIYIILGILYENFIHPITVMSALPPATLGGLLTLLIFNEPLSLHAFVGIIMLLGIVLKNGIMMIDFANEEILHGKSIEESIVSACKMRFRPILMTTFAAAMGAVPIALGIGGLTAESRRPLGLVIVGGLLFSQVLTLFVTPIVFIYLERLREKFGNKPLIADNQQDSA
ncbi:MAG: efflux RND transporter permease subunit, partial [Simkaniaceae bacterium]|nr:efflux RND transporter permease subunit [Simkaniaceae bacterium]